MSRPSSSSSRPVSRQSTSNSLAPPRPMSSRSSRQTVIGRPRSRNSSRLTPLIQELVNSFPHSINRPRGASYETASELKSYDVLNALENLAKHAPRMELDEVDARIEGLVEKSRITMDETLAESLEKTYGMLRTHVSNTSNRESHIRTSNLPTIIQFLLDLSARPDDDTRRKATDVLFNLEHPEGSQPVLTWEDIVRDDPLEGDHWDNPFPDNASSSSSSSTASSRWLFNVEGNAHEGLSRQPAMEPPITPSSSNGTSVLHDIGFEALDLDAHGTVETLKHQQYWLKQSISTHADEGHSQSLDMRGPASLGPAVMKTLRQHGIQSIETTSPHYITEIDAVREVLFCLQGLPSWLVAENSMSELTIKATAPRLKHLSVTTFHSLLSVFISHASTLRFLRRFIRSTYNTIMSGSSANPTVRKSSRVLEAFASAVDQRIQSFEAWAAAQEESICQAQHGVGSSTVVSLLSLEQDICETMSVTYDVLASIVRSIIWDDPPSTTTVLLLDSLFLAIQQRISEDDVTSRDALLKVFITTAEPVWSHVRHWLRNGMSLTGGADAVPQEEEFFIRRTEVMVDSVDFWIHGYAFRKLESTKGRIERPMLGRRTTNSNAVPAFLEDVAKDILSAGKAVGLMRALHVDDFFDNLMGDEDEDEGDMSNSGWLHDWMPFKDVVGRAYNLTSTSLSGEIEDENSLDSSSVSLTSVDVLASVIRECLDPWFRLAHARLNRVIVSECGLWEHLRCMEALYLTHSSDAMAQFGAVIADRISTNRPWNDYHTLNSIFQDIAGLGPIGWIDPLLVRFAYNSTGVNAPSTSVRVLEGLSVNFQVPFPLSILFGPTTMQIYTSILVLLLQLYLARRAINDIICGLKEANSSNLSLIDLRAFHALRSRLLWLVNTLTNHITTNVIEVRLSVYHDALTKGTSLDNMLVVQEEHLASLRHLCFLDPSATSSHKAIIAILDLAIHAASVFTAFTDSHDLAPNLIAPRSVLHVVRRKKRLNRVQRARRANVVGYEPVQAFESSDEDNDGNWSDVVANEGIISVTVSLPDRTVLSMEEERAVVVDFQTRIEQMTLEMDGLVRYLLRQLEKAAESGARSEEIGEDVGDGREGEIMGVLLFNLEGYDL